MNIIEELHVVIFGGHRAWREKMYKILRVGFYWPILFLEVNSKVISSAKCQIFAPKKKLPSLPSIPLLIEASFS